MKKALMEIENLSKTFKDKGLIFDDLNLKVYPNEHLAIVAKNGTGKTVLLETLIGLRKIAKGKIKWNFESNSIPYEKIGFLFQSNNLSNNFYVKDYINLLFKDKNVDLIFLEDMLNKFEIKAILPMSVANLSGGQKQILKIVITFAYKHEIILLDEFDNNLDIVLKSQLIDFIKDYANQQKSTIILVSHNLQDIKQICPKIGFLKNGKIEKIVNSNRITLQQFKTYL